MIYAQMYQSSVAHPGNDWRNYPVPATGTDAVLVLPCGTRAQKVQKAREYAQRMNERLGKQYIGFRLMQGTSFLDSWPLGEVISL